MTWWLVASILGVLLTSAIALPMWNAGLRDTLGRVLTIEQIHLIEYAGLGCVAAFGVHRQASLRWSWGLLIVIVAGVGLADELLQIILPNRVFQWSDVWLNWAGGLLGVTLAPATIWMRHRWRSATSSMS